MAKKTVGRPQLPDSEKHERPFRLRFQDDDANLILALAKKADVPPAALLRSMIARQLPTYRLMLAAGQKIKVEAGE